MFTRALTDLDSRVSRGAMIRASGSLSVPPDWRGDKTLWARIVAKARLYATCRASYFADSDDGPVVARLFDDLAESAELISRGIPIYILCLWLNSQEIRPHPDAKALRNLIHIIDSLHVF